jgi:1-deoxy-D-xylulose-5-phosphate synthase
VTMEEGCVIGGFGTAVMESLMEHGVMVPVTRIGIPDVLVDHAKPDESKVALELTPAQMAERIRQAFSLEPIAVS